jgi:hypothetical protein
MPTFQLHTSNSKFEDKDAEFCRHKDIVFFTKPFQPKKKAPDIAALQEVRRHTAENSGVFFYIHKDVFFD